MDQCAVSLGYLPGVFFRWVTVHWVRRVMPALAEGYAIDPVSASAGAPTVIPKPGCWIAIPPVVGGIELPETGGLLPGVGVGYAIDPVSDGVSALWEQLASPRPAIRINHLAMNFFPSVRGHPRALRCNLKALSVTLRVSLAFADTVPHELPIEAIDLLRLLRGKIRIAESFQTIVTGLYIMTIHNRAHRQLVTCGGASQSSPATQSRIEAQNEHAAA